MTIPPGPAPALAQTIGDPPPGGPATPPRRGRLGLRAKLWVGFGGLFAMVLAASGMGVVVLTHYSSAYDRIFKENYDSVTYCERMMEALDGLDYEARRAAADGTPPAAGGSTSGTGNSPTTSPASRVTATCPASRR